MKHQKFWMVYSQQGKAPTYMHLTREDAQNEASRLARNNLGKEFFVLKAVSGVVTKTPKIKGVKMVKDRDFQTPF